jgi:uncharacterized protein (TIGR02217 family)
MSNDIFPKLAGLSLGSGWEPRFSTKILTATSGREYRASLMANPVYMLSLRYNFLRSSKQELQTLIGFFLARKGSYDSFLYEHPDDNAMVDQQIGAANGSITSFQLLRAIGTGFIEPVQNPKSVDAIKVNGVLKTLGTDYTVSSTGLITFTAAPLTGAITWSGSYYYRARFADDSSTYAKLMAGIWENKKVDLTASLGTKI